MSKADLANHLATKTGLHGSFARAIIEVLLARLKDSLMEGQIVELHGFGRFQVSHRRARIGTNPKTGQRVQIPASRSVKFKPGKKMIRLIEAGARQDHE